MRFTWLFAALPVFFIGNAFAETIRVCTTEWPPYTVGGSDAVEGIHTRVVTEAFRRLGLDAQIENVAWERCWKELPKDTYQAAYSASFNEARARVAIYPATPLQRLSYVAVVRRGEAEGLDGSVLARLPRPLAAPRGYSITTELRQLGHEVDDGAMKDSQNLEKLVSGRVGTAVMERQVAASLIASLKLADRVEILPATLSAKDYFLVVSRAAGGSEAAAQSLADRLDRVLADLRRERLAERLRDAEARR
ncbi:MAG TPA: transporter substrate-binding domain-containing protein [Magnetospirillum sp.]|nr:transporter substrate-binding domain-containing protein [Magnetospirillum sp.]